MTEARVSLANAAVSVNEHGMYLAVHGQYKAKIGWCTQMSATRACDVHPL